MQELIEIVRESLGREPQPEELGEEAARILRMARAATANADRARARLDAAAQAWAMTPAKLRKHQEKLAAQMGRHFHGDIVRRVGTMDEALSGLPVRVPDELIMRSAFDPYTGAVGTPSFGGVPGVEKNRDLQPWKARGLSYDVGQFYAFYRSDAVVRKAVSDIIGVIAGATIEFCTPSALTARSAELLGVDRDECDRIADALNTELHLSQLVDFDGVLQEMLRVAIVNGADVHEYMMDPYAPLGQRVTGISPRLPNTWMQWIQDADGRPVYLRQTNPGGVGPVAGLVDLTRCIRVAIDQDGDNFEGLSLLRSARAWDVLEFEVVSATILQWQRFGPGIPIIRSPAGTSAPASQKTYEALATYANLASAVLEVGAGVDVDLLQMHPTGTGFVEISDLCTRMKRTALLDSLGGLGMESSGAYNLGDMKSQMWLKGLRVFCSQIERGFSHFVRTYVDTYFGPQKVYPQLRISGFAARSPSEVIEVQTKFAGLVATGQHTNEELVKIAEAAEVVWNGRGSEADEGDVGADGGIAAAVVDAPKEPLQVGSLQVAAELIRSLRPADATVTPLAPDVAVELLIAAGIPAESAQRMVAAQMAAAAPEALTTDPAPTDGAAPAPAPTAPEEPAQPEGAIPPGAAQQAAADGRRARSAATEKWTASMADLALTKRIAAGEPLSRLELRTLESYFRGLDDPTTLPGWADKGPAWQEFHAFGGQAMADWLGVVLAETDEEPITRSAPAKYSHIDFTPPEGVRAAAKRALEVRDEKPESQRGMTPVGIARARDLSNGRAVSPDTARRMLAFFERHEGNKSGETWDEQGKGWQAWHGWGGDAGFAWARKLVKQMDAADEEPTTRSAEGCGCEACLETRAAKPSLIEVTTRGGTFMTFRALRGNEGSVAWDEIEAQKARADERIRKAIEREQRKHRAAFIDAADGITDPLALAVLSVDWTPNYRAAIEPTLRQYGRFVSSDMLDEIRDVAGSGFTVDTQAAEGTTPQQVEASAQLLAQAANDRTNEALRGAAVAVAGGSPRSTLTGAGVGVGYGAAGLVAQTLSTATNFIRAETAAKRGPRIARAVYSAVMDRYTCPACAAADGTVVEYGSAEYLRLSPPNPQCRSVENSKGSENRCQCVWVYEFDTTPDTRAAEPVRPTVRLYVGPPGAGKSSLAAAEGGAVVDRDAFVLVDGEYQTEGVEASLEALAEALQDGSASYVTCALSAPSRAKLAQRIADMGADVTECVEVTADAEWLRAVNEDRGERQIPWDQWQHLIDAWEPVADEEFSTVRRVRTY